MPDWKRIIVGDAFKAHSFDYYRDFFLIWPFMLCSLVGISQLFAPSTPGGRMYGFKVTACAVIISLLAKEKRIPVLVASLYIGLRAGIRSLIGLFSLRPYWKAYLLGFLFCGGLAFVLLRSLKGWRPSYRLPPRGETYILDLIVGIASLLCGVLILRL